MAIVSRSDSKNSLENFRLSKPHNLQLGKSLNLFCRLLLIN